MNLTINVAYTIDDADGVSLGAEIAAAEGLRATLSAPAIGYGTKALTYTFGEGDDPIIVVPEPTIGFIVGGAIVDTIPTHVMARGWSTIPFDADGNTPTYATLSGAAPPTFAYDDDAKVIHLNITAGGWVNLQITVEGVDFDFWVNAS